MSGIEPRTLLRILCTDDVLTFAPGRSFLQRLELVDLNSSVRKS